MKKILIIEDDADLQELLGFAFKRGGFETRGAEDGGYGMEMLYTMRPDAVVLDLMLPGLPGLDVLARITRDPVLQIPVVVITAYEDYDGVLKRRCMDLGARAFIEKPLDPGKIVALVREAVGVDAALVPPQRKM